MHFTTTVLLCFGSFSVIAAGCSDQANHESDSSTDTARLPVTDASLDATSRPDVEAGTLQHDDANQSSADARDAVSTHLDAARDTSVERDVFTPPVDGSSGGTLFDDQFNGASIDTTLWSLLDRTDQWGNGQAAYVPANDSIAGGALQMLTQPNNSGSNYVYSSGALVWNTFHFLYGTIEYRAKMAAAPTWPAIWLLGANCQRETGGTYVGPAGCSWPNVGSDEIDITEMPGWNGVGSNVAVNQQIHATDAQGQNHNDGCTANTSDVTTNWHTYQLIWQPGSLIWKVDGVTTCTVNASYVPATPMFLILDTAVGGQIGTSSLPATMSVDYITVRP